MRHDPTLYPITSMVIAGRLDGHGRPVGGPFADAQVRAALLFDAYRAGLVSERSGRVRAAHRASGWPPAEALLAHYRRGGDVNSWVCRARYRRRAVLDALVAEGSWKNSWQLLNVRGYRRVRVPPADAQAQVWAELVLLTGRGRFDGEGVVWDAELGDVVAQMSDVSDGDWSIVSLALAELVSLRGWLQAAANTSAGGGGG